MKQRETSRQLQAVETRKRIVDTALNLFLKNGFEQVTIRTIAKESGTSIGSFYTYFKTKSEIIIEQFAEIDTYYENLYRTINREITAQQRLEDFVKGQLEYLMNDIKQTAVQVLYLNQISQRDTPSVIFNERRNLSLILTDIINFGQQTGEFRKDVDAVRMHRYLLRGLRGLFLDWTVSGPDFDLIDEGMQYLDHFLLVGLFKHKDQTT